MPHPFEIVDVINSGYALWETITPVAAEANFEIGPIDLIDILPIATTGRGPGGPNGLAYTYRPLGGSDSRHKIYYAVRAEGAGGIPAPAEILFLTHVLDPLAPAAIATQHVLHRVVISGPQFQFNAFPPLKPMMSGSFECEARTLFIWFVNGLVAQTEFFCGVYVRSF